MLPIEIRAADLDAPALRALLAEHLADMRTISPPESVHALDVESLRAPHIRVWTAWRGTALLGCAALRELDATHAEIKSMRTAAAHRGTGVAQALLDHLLATARARGYMRISLETGSQPQFEPARALYRKNAFRPCPPFADYVVDPNSVCMTRILDPGPDRYPGIDGKIGI